MKYNYSNSNQLSKTLCFGSQVMVSMVLTLDIAPALETTLMPHHYFATGPLLSFTTHCSTDRCQTYHTYHISGSFYFLGTWAIKISVFWIFIEIVKSWQIDYRQKLINWKSKTPTQIHFMAVCRGKEEERDLLPGGPGQNGYDSHSLQAS